MMPKSTDHPGRAKLSERQRRILDFIESFIQANGYPPTIREIGAAVNIGSTSVVNYNLNKLVRDGYLERSQKVSRGLQLVLDEDEAPNHLRVRRAMQDNILPVPIMGKIVASAPVTLPGDDFGYYFDQEDMIEVPHSLISKVPTEQLYALRVQGHSMIDAMVNEGDIVVLHRQQTADDGDMVAVWLKENNETTLKYFYREGKRVRLQPANPTMEAIYVDARQVEIQGRVVAVLRSL